MSVYVQNPLNDNDEPQSLIGPVITALTIAAAGVLYLVTRHPLLAGLLPWLHGGWATFCTGLWILRTDPIRRRSWTCFAFYLAAACWKAAAVALATMYIFFVAGMPFGVMPSYDEFVVTSLVFAAGLVMSTFLGIVAIVAALSSNVKIYFRTHLRAYVHGNLSHAAQIDARVDKWKFARMLVGSTIAFPLIVLDCVLMIRWFEKLALLKGPPGILTIIGVFATGIGLPILAFKMAGWLSDRVLADCPRQCWPPGTV